MNVSVVIPVRDDAVALERCLRALEAQTRPPDEVLVVDNGSADASAWTAVRHHAWVLPWRPPGVAGAVAAGFDAAGGEVLARLDADSVPPPDWVARVAGAFERDPALAALTGPGVFLGVSPAVRFLGRWAWLGGYFTVIRGVLGHPPLYGSNLALRRDLWAQVRDRVHRDRADVHDDLDLSLQLPPGVRIRYDPTLRVAVSGRSLVRPHAVRNGILLAANTLAVSDAEEVLRRRRLAWALAALRPGPRSRGVRRLLEQGEHGAAQLVWGRLARTVTAGVEVEGGADVVGIPTVELEWPEVLRADRAEDRDPGLAE
jgi:glycosyltransferase involved in cell wall biosynthesis